MEGSEFYVIATDECSKYLVDNLSSHANITGRNVSMDRYFTSVTIAHYLKEKKMTLVGTMRVQIEKVFPKNLWKCKIVMIRISSSFANEDDLMLTSYVVKKKSGKRNILLLSTMHDNVRCSRDERKKPNTICFYDKAKGGLDVVDVVIGKYTTYMLDTARTNAHTVFQEIKHDIRTFDFIW